MASSNHPKVIVVGPQGSGKSTFVAGISGIYLGTATTSPVEWHLSPSATWAATVSVAYHRPNMSSSMIDTTAPQKLEVGITCSTPYELQLLLKRAELLLFYPGIDVSSVSSLSEDAINAGLISMTTSLSGGTIYVDLQCQQISKEITIVDTPGLANAEESDTQLPVIFIKQLIRSYTESEKTLLAVILPISDSEKHCSQMVSFVKSIDKHRIRTTILLNQLEASTTSFSLSKILRRYQCFYTHQPAQRVPFAYASLEVQRFRQDEVAFFHFCKPWSSQVERDNLGVANILKAWSMLHDNLLRSQPTVHSRHGFIRTFCVWLLLSIVVGLAVYLTIHGELFYLLCLALCVRIPAYLK